MAFHEMHDANHNEHLLNIESPQSKPAEHKIELTALSTTKRVMIDQMFKTILRGFRNFYRKLFKVYQLNQPNAEVQKDKEKLLTNFIRDLGLNKLFAEQNQLRLYQSYIGFSAGVSEDQLEDTC